MYMYTMNMHNYYFCSSYFHTEHWSLTGIEEMGRVECSSVGKFMVGVCTFEVYADLLLVEVCEVHFVVEE